MDQPKLVEGSGRNDFNVSIPNVSPKYISTTTDSQNFAQDKTNLFVLLIIFVCIYNIVT